MLCNKPAVRADDESTSKWGARTAAAWEVIIELAQYRTRSKPGQFETLNDRPTTRAIATERTTSNPSLVQAPSRVVTALVGFDHTELASEINLPTRVANYFIVSSTSRTPLSPSISFISFISS